MSNRTGYDPNGRLKGFYKHQYYRQDSGGRDLGRELVEDMQRETERRQALDGWVPAGEEWT